MKSICLLSACLLVLLYSCSQPPKTFDISTQRVDIYPDYLDLTIPVNIAPLNFMIENARKIQVHYEGKNGNLYAGGRNKTEIPVKKWKKFLNRNIGDTIWMEIYVKNDNHWTKFSKYYYYVSPDSIDQYVAYRLIPPGFDEWNQMGLYQRNIETFNENAIITNVSTKKNCMNCHTFCMNNPEAMTFHMRQEFSGTYLWKDNTLSKLATKTDYTISNCVYPYWHPSGKYIAFSTNATAQSLHSKPGLNIEVYDSASDIVILDVDRCELFTDSLINRGETLETYPAFSPDGKKLYFCCSEMAKPLPRKYDRIKYSLCSIDFDPLRKTFGNRVDTLISSYSVNKSVTFAHPSFDGKYILCTLSDYGCFPSWNIESDLYLFHLSTSELKCLNNINSPFAEGFGSWSLNSKWMVFSSRRDDQQYNRLYFSHIDKDGNTSKAFLLPQQDPELNIRNLYAYNKPEFITSKVKLKSEEIAEAAKRQNSRQVTFSGGEEVNLKSVNTTHSVN